MHQAYVTKFFSRNERGVKYALYHNDKPVTAHKFVLAHAQENDPVYVGIINAMTAALKAGAEALVVYTANVQVLNCIAKPHAVTNPQTVSYLMNIDALRQQLPTTFAELPFAEVNNHYWNAYYYTQGG